MRKSLFRRHRPFLFIILLLSGCWDQTSIDEKAYVVAVGLDKSENDGNLKVTYLISNPELAKQEGGTSEPSQEIVSFEANDMIVSKDMANAVVAKDISYNLLSVYIVSEELAKDKEFVRWMYDAMKGRENKRDIPLIVTKEKARDFINNTHPQLETRIHKYFELILNSGNEIGYIPDSKIHNYFRITEADADLFLAIYGTTEKVKEAGNKGEEDYLAGELDIKGSANHTQFMGSAVFKEGKMIGTLTGEETRLSIVLNETLNMDEILTTFPDPFNEKYRVTVRIIQKEKNDVKIKLNNGNPTIDVNVPLYMEILTNHSMTHYANNSENRKRLEKSLEENVTEKLDKLVKKNTRRI